jgi:NADPH2:quinone reductase
MVAPLIIPHSDGAGQIDATGSGVTARIGERVWVWNGQWRRPRGTAAEYIVVPSKQAVSLPDNVGYAEGACLGIPALTAAHAIELAHVAPGATVLVVGGAGSVGHYAIQLAKLHGAKVITTVSSDVKAMHAVHGGADATVNYREENVAGRVAAFTDRRGVDSVIELDVSSNGKLYPGIVRPHGTVVVYGTSSSEATLPSHWMMVNSITLRLFLIYDIAAGDRARAIAEISQLLKDGRLIHTVALQLPLERIAEAHEIVEGGKSMGNVVIEL